LKQNHFHFLVRANTEDASITKFMLSLSTSYSKYFNIKYDMVGRLFQERFRSKIVDNDDYLLHLSRYIHLNPVVAGLVRNIEQYKWSSYSEYALSNIICSTSEILNFFPSKKDYKQFIQDQIDYGKTLGIIKNHDFDDFSFPHPECKPKSTNL
jgi:putative transposase